MKSHAWTDSNMMIMRLYEAAWDVMRDLNNSVRSASGLMNRAMISHDANARITFE
jgi:hypothetical protein